MEQSKQNDISDWGEAGPVRVRGRISRTPANNRTEPVDSYKVVHSQEPLWVLDLRFTEPYGEGGIEFRVVLRPTGSDGWWPGTWAAKFASGRDGSLK